jgi:hypothetical protein
MSRQRRLLRLPSLPQTDQRGMADRYGDYGQLQGAEHVYGCPEGGFGLRPLRS